MFGLQVSRAMRDTKEAEIWTVLATLAEVERNITHIIVLQRHDGPVDESDEFLDNSFNPHLDEGEFRGNTVDGDICYVSLAEVGLMEHVRIVVQSEQMTHGIGLLGGEEGVNVSRTS